MSLSLLLSASLIRSEDTMRKKGSKSGPKPCIVYKKPQKGDRMINRRLFIGAMFLFLLLGCTYGGGSMKVNVFNPAAPLYEEGLDAYNSGDYSRAITAFTDVVNYYPNNGLADEAMFMLAKTYEKTGDDLDALRYYKLFASRYPNHKWTAQASKKIEALSKKIEEGENGRNRSRSSQ